jgi:signal peptidase II
MKLWRGRLAVVACVLLATIGCDQAGKHLARASLPASEAVPAGRLLTLFLTENTGGFLSWGSGLTAAARFWVLTVGAAVGLFLAACLFATSTSSWRILVPGALVTGGGLSNLLDRLANGGRVTDFLVLHLGPLHTGVFNIADLAITAGTVLLGIELVKNPRSSELAPKATVDPRAGIARWAGRRRDRNRPNP